MYEPNTKSADVYYTGRYWNDHPQVVSYLNRRATGDPAMSWMDHLLAHRGGPFHNALILNCGNGWVERDLLARGVIERGVGVDLLDDLLDQPRAIAQDQRLPLEYVQMDTNSAAFPPGDIDLVVNHAAMHHVAYIDRVMREIARRLPPDGVFVSWDYVGPHRNQYTAQQWEAAFDVDRALPEAYRCGMHYPGLAMMLETDPSEAVHSELFWPTLRRYFTIEHEARLGGAIAYLLLTHNDSLFEGRPHEIRPIVERVIRADEAFVDAHPDSTLFAYVIARPNKDALRDRAQLDAWTAEEDEREHAAVTAHGIYYPETYVATMVRTRNELTEALGAAPPPAPRRTRIRRAAGRLPGARGALRMFRRAVDRLPDGRLRRLTRRI